VQQSNYFVGSQDSPGRLYFMACSGPLLIGLTLLFSSLGFTSMALPADNGLITEQSRYSVKETVKRFEAAVKAKESLGFMVFTELDHAAAAKKFGLEMRPRTVIVYGNPKFGTPVMVKTPLLAIDVPPKALEWEDDQGNPLFGAAGLWVSCSYPLRDPEVKNSIIHLRACYPPP
jgi:uncharacterized protein (DUF302 family)